MTVAQDYLARLDEPTASSWAPVDLAPIVAGIQAGEIVGPVPTLMARTDGVALLYPGEIHSLAGEPEAGKGWIAGAETARLLAAGETTLYVDFEDAPASVVTRLLALDAPPAAVVERFIYVKPEEALQAGALDVLTSGHRPALAVLDGMSEAYALLGLDAYANQDVPRFLQALARPLAATGAAVLLIDHVVKSAEARGRYALGAQHKLAGVAAAYGVEVIDPPSRKRPGLVKLVVHKDRHGHVRGHASGGTIALVRVTPEDEGARVTVTLDPPDSTSESGSFRPTTLMERVSAFVTEHPGATRNQIKDGVSGKTSGKDLALQILVDEEYVEQRRDGQAKRHHSLRTYRSDGTQTLCQSPGPQPVPTGPQDQWSPTGPPVPTPTRGTGTGDQSTATSTPPTGPRSALTADCHQDSNR
jgi:AAA domain